MTAQVSVCREVQTTAGTIAPGTKVAALPAGDGGWLILLPTGQDRPRAVVVPAGWVRVSEAELTGHETRDAVLYD
jgi:hypothetical protein